MFAKTNNKPVDTYDSIKKFYVNLDNRPDRKASIEKQLGQSIQRVSAVSAKDLSDEYFNSAFDNDSSYKKYLVNLTKGQKACTLSHWKIYQEIANDISIDDDSYVLISEDDNKFSSDFKERINQLLKVLSKPKFSEANLVILRYQIFTEFVDYIPDDYIMNYDRYETYNNKVKKSHICRWVFGDLQTYTKDQYFKFDYDSNVAHDDSNILMSRTQNFFAPNSIVPYSSACYLVKKSAIKRLLEHTSKPYWITDDFKALVPIWSILVTSPLLAVDQPEVSQTDIQFTDSLNNAQCTRIFTEYESNLCKYLKEHPFIYRYIYSNSCVKRFIGKTILRMKKFDRVRYDLNFK